MGSVEFVEELIVKPAAHSRRTYSRKGKRALVELCKAPGASVAGLALAHGINANLLGHWIKRYGGESAVGREPRAEKRTALLPVKMAEPVPSAAVVADGAGEGVTTSRLYEFPARCGGGQGVFECTVLAVEPLGGKSRLYA